MDYDCQSSSSSNSYGDNKRFQYPTENLGTSWGSYLQSGPPTRAGLAGGHKKVRNHTETVNEELAELGIPVNIKRSKPKAVVFDPFTQVRSIEDTSQPTTSTPEVHVHPASKSNTMKELKTQKENSEPQNESDTIVNYKKTLLKKTQTLMESINTSQQEIAKNGTNTDRLKALTAKDKTYSNLRQLVCEPINGNGVEVLSTGVLLDVIHYLTEVLNSLVQQSQKQLQHAESLQKSGRQLSKSQDRFFRDQHEIHKAIEEARMQLIKEQNAFKEEITIKQENMERLQLALRQQIPTKAQKQTSTLGTVHEVMQGRNQMAALLQTQKEQAKLEKLLFRQQRDIQCIQRDLGNTKSELLSAQDHALKLEHKIVLHRRKAMPGQPREHAKALTRKEDRKGHKTTDTGLRGVLTAQSTLDREMLRIKRQIEEQQIQERLASKNLEASYQSLKKRAVALRQQAAGIKGKSLYVPSDETDNRDDDRQAQQQRKRKTHIPKLPQLQRLPKQAKVRKKPTYTFSKQELVTLACFSDEEATDNVMEWLEMQGNLVD